MKLRKYKVILIAASWIFISAIPVYSMGQRERKIVVFKPNVSDQEKLDLVSRFQTQVLKKTKIVNGLALTIPSITVNQLAQDPRVLRIDPDVEIFAIPDNRFGRNRISAQGICDWWPWIPWCNPSPTPDPSPTPIPTTPTNTPTPTPTSTPTSTPTPTNTPTPTPTQKPSEPTPTPTSTPIPPTPTNTPIPSLPTATPIPGKQPIPWNISKVKAPQSWPNSTGNNVRVAVIDSGIDTNHPDLANNLTSCINFIYSWRNCEDDNGHGTHVSGTIAAEDNAIGVVGVAPQAEIHSLKVLNNRGRGYLSDLLEALDWAIDNNMEIINMSLATSSNITSFKEAVEKVNAAGIIQVAAAGNYGPNSNTVTYPGKYPQVIAVAATDNNNNVPSFSSRGPEVDLAAPGENIYSTNRRDGYTIKSGTSMASPHVAGAVALRLFLHPGETPAEIEALLENTTDSLPFPSTTVGAGLLNVYNFITAP